MTKSILCLPGGWPANRKTIIPKMFFHCCEDFEPHIRLPSLGTQQRDRQSSRESDFEGQWDLITWLPQYKGKQTPHLEGTNKILHAPKPRGKKQRPHRRLNQTYLLVLEGFLQRHQYAMVHHGDGAPAATVLDGAPCLEALLKISSSHAIKPADSRARLPQAKQLIGREHSPTHQ